MVDNLAASQAPANVATRGTNLVVIDNTGCGRGQIRIQFNLAPPVMAANVRRVIGTERFASVSLTLDRGVLFRSDHSRLIEKRKE